MRVPVGNGSIEVEIDLNPFYALLSQWRSRLGGYAPLTGMQALVAQESPDEHPFWERSGEMTRQQAAGQLFSGAYEFSENPGDLDSVDTARLERRSLLRFWGVGSAEETQSETHELFAEALRRNHENPCTNELPEMEEKDSSVLYQDALENWLFS